MQFNVAQLLKESTGSTRNYEFIEEFIGSGRVADRVEGQLNLIKTHQGILARVKLGVRVTAGCSRCDNEFPRTSQLRIEEEFFPATDLRGGGRVDGPQDPDAFLIDRHNVLDLSEVVRQSLIADQPMKPLCSTDCRGLCQVCGANLNASDCRCTGSGIDPQWGALAELLSRNTGRETQAIKRN